MAWMKAWRRSSTSQLGSPWLRTPVLTTVDTAGYGSGGRNPRNHIVWLPRRMFASRFSNSKPLRSQAHATHRYVLAALVINQTGCLARIANLFAARGYNIDSLVVGRTEIPELSRMTVVVHGTEANVTNMKKQLEDVVQVARVNVLQTGNSDDDLACVERDLMLVKVSTEAQGSRTEVIELASMFDAKVVDVRPKQILMQLASTPSRIANFIELLKPIGIIEIHRSGVIAMDKGASVSGDLESLEGATRTFMGGSNSMDDVDATALPPG